MKLKSFTRHLPLILSAIASANGAIVTRTNTADVLTLGAAWSTGAVPTNADTATWDAASTLSNASTAITAGFTWGGLNVQDAAGDVSLTYTGGFTANFGAVSLGSKNLSIMTGAAANTLSFTSLTGTGILTLNNGTSTLNLAALNTANAINFNGTLRLRGGNATTVPGMTAASFMYLGNNAALTQAAGTAFALDTGTSATSAKDVILDGGVWGGKTITLSSLSGFGSLRRDSGAVSTVNLVVNQANDTTFNGLVLTHTSGAGVVRKTTFEKSGIGSLTLAGIIGKQTQSAGAAAADLDLTVSGGTLVLAAANTRTGITTIGSGGTLQAGNGGTAGLIGGTSITNNGALVFDYGTGALVENNQAVSGTGTITKKGAGSLTLTGSVASSGAISVTAGTLRVGTTLDAPVTIQSGGRLATGTNAAINFGAVGSSGSLTLAAGSSSTFRLVDSLSHDRMFIDQVDSLTIGGTHTITPVLQGTPAFNDAFPIFDYEGTLQGSAADFQVIPGSRFEVVNNVANSSIDLVYKGGTLVWTAENSNTWDLDSTTNWSIGGVDTKFLTSDPVLFDDTAPPSGNTVTLSGALAPASTTFNNSSLAYTLTGTDPLAGGALVKNGSADTTLLVPATYSGGTTVNAGKLRIGDGGTGGDIGAGAVVVETGATLEFNRSNATPGTPDLDYKTNIKLRNVSGAGGITLTGGAILFNYTGTGSGFAEANSWAGFTGNLTVKGGSEFRTIRNGATAMGSGDIILGDALSSGTLAAIEGNWTWTNDIILTGTANKIISRSTGSPPRSLKLQGVISGSGGLSLEDAGATMTEPNRGFIITGANTMNGTLTIATGVPVRIGGVPGDTDILQSNAAPAGSLGAATVVNNGTLTFSRTDAHSVDNDISGSGAIRIGIPVAAGLGDTTTQVVTYTGTASHGGNTTVNNGALVIGSGGSMGGAAISVEATATLGGDGLANAPLTAAGTVNPGIGIGTLNVNGNTTLTGTLAIDVNGAAVDKLAVTGDLTLTGSALTVAETGPGFTTHVVAECTGTLTGTPIAPVGYSLSISGKQLILTKDVASGYSTWADANAGGQNADDDFDMDGTSNGVEYFMGETGSGFTANPAVVTTGGVRTVTWPRDSAAAASFKVQVSTTLATGGWTDITPPHASIDESNPDQVVFTLPSATPSTFCRLVVTVNP